MTTPQPRLFGSATQNPHGACEDVQDLRKQTVTLNAELVRLQSTLRDLQTRLDAERAATRELLLRLSTWLRRFPARRE